MAGSPSPAAAQSIFDFFFGGGMRRAPVSSYADPRHDRHEQRSRSGGTHIGGGAAYCVRLCDGRHFPISNAGNAAEICKSFCPASPTKVFSGGGAIENTYSSDGKRYSDIPNAFVYRAKLVPDCSCDGKSPTGLARVDAKHDDTLRQGDIVATDKGLMSYRGENRKAVAQFSPLKSASGLSSTMRRQLMATRVAPDRTREEMKGADDAAVTSRNVDQRSRAAR